MKEPDPILEVHVTGSSHPAYAGEWVPLALTLRHPDSSAGGVKLKHIACADKEVQLDTDLFPNDLEIRPGETYLLTLPIRVPRPRTVDLDRILIQVGRDDQPSNDVGVSLPPQLLPVRAAVAREIMVRVKPVCAYECGSKVELSFEHRGATLFEDLAFTVGPDDAIRAGKRVLRRSTFGPGDREQTELVVDTETLTVSAVARAHGEPTEGRWMQPIERSSGRCGPRFQFLEPRRLSVDDVVVKTQTEAGDVLIAPVTGAYPLHAGVAYEVDIRPRAAGIHNVQLRDIPGVVHVRNAEADGGAWKFWLDVKYPERFSKAERLFYDVESSGGPLKGEIGITLRPAWGKHLQLAAALGIAMTVQGVGALLRLLLRQDVSLADAVDHFHIASDYQLLFPLCIPLFWAGLWLYDRIQYRLAN
jgi:hypothetical protein